MYVLGRFKGAMQRSCRAFVYVYGNATKPGNVACVDGGLMTGTFPETVLIPMICDLTCVEANISATTSSDAVSVSIQYFDISAPHGTVEFYGSFVEKISELLGIHLSKCKVNIMDRLNTLRVFEAVCRLESHSRAAEEMNVTEGAVSKNIKSLESALGTRLFCKEGRRAVRNAEGEKLFSDISHAF